MISRVDARRALLAVGADLTGDDPVTGSDAHYRALAVLLDDVDTTATGRPSVGGVAYLIEQAVEDLTVMLAGDDNEGERERMEETIWEELAERANRRLESIRYRRAKS